MSISAQLPKGTRQRTGIPLHAAPPRRWPMGVAKLMTSVLWRRVSHDTRWPPKKNTDHRPIAASPLILKTLAADAEGSALTSPRAIARDDTGVSRASER